MRSGPPERPIMSVLSVAENLTLEGPSGPIEIIMLYPIYFQPDRIRNIGCSYSMQSIFLFVVI